MFYNLSFESLFLDVLMKVSNGRHDNQAIRQVASSLLLTEDSVTLRIFTCQRIKELIVPGLFCDAIACHLIIAESTSHIYFRQFLAMAEASNFERHESCFA